MRIYEIFLLLCSQRDNHTSRFVSYLQCRDLSIQPLYMTIHQPRLSTFFPSQNFNQHTLTYCPDNWLKQWVITTPFPGSFLAASKMGSVVDGVGIFQPLSLSICFSISVSSFFFLFFLIRCCNVISLNNKIFLSYFPPQYASYQNMNHRKFRSFWTRANYIPCIPSTPSLQFFSLVILFLCPN